MRGLVLGMMLVGSSVMAQSRSIIPPKACKDFKAAVLDIGTLSSELIDAELILRDLASQGMEQAQWVMALHQDGVCSPTQCLSGVLLMSVKKTGVHLKAEAFCKDQQEGI